VSKWRRIVKDGGGIVLDMFPHWRYLLADLFGPASAVCARATAHLPEAVGRGGRAPQRMPRITRTGTAYSFRPPIAAKGRPGLIVGVVIGRGDPGVIEEIVPKSAACAEAFGGSPGTGLFPEEITLVARATEKRRREFTAGRECARAALAGLGLAAVPILRGYRGAPQWPDGVVGSITHCPGYVAAAVARAQDLAAIGLDAEPNAALPGGVLELISLPAERARLRRLAAAAQGTSWDRLLFCAKEAVYKAWFPLTGRWLGFADADITIDATERAFTARIQVPAPVIGGSPLTSFTGCWLASNDLLLAAIAVPA
jgi:4'-phosphopantetheinyl transferase EntD